MKSLIYKYMGAEVFSRALTSDGTCSFKCSHPKDFNDPYELFLTINFQQNPEMLATYREAIGDLPQYPTTCFSRSPGVIPMWAHYAHGHSGIVLEFNETAFLEHFPKANFGDVDYLSQASENLLGMLSKACYIGKPRYYYLLQRGVLNAAYFKKHTLWSYEQERRLIVGEGDVKTVGDLMLVDFPVDVITSVIVGNKASTKTKRIALDKARNIGANYYELNISKVSIDPYFVDNNGIRYLFRNDGLKPCDHICEDCGEPVLEDSEVCSWCAIEDCHIEKAYADNPLRMLQGAGFLEDYIKSMENIGKK